MRRLAVSLFLCAWAAVAPAGHAQNVMTVDASQPAPAPQPVAAKLGSNRNPQGQTIGVNSQYLTLDGQPWLPVMGEFHYSRYPAAQWEPELLKMKAAGINIVSTYVIWIHHEETEGHFDWTGQRDLRRFVQLCSEHGLYVFVRVGPWAHAEVRNGGLPDWVLKNSPVRQNNPVYLREVDSFYTQIGAQLRGQMWKDGGPVIGVQIENEYSAKGAGKGNAHIRTLKQMAIRAGLDAPLYTVTGWDGAAIPLDSVLPVYGGYPDAPWAGSSKPMPPNEVYAFRFRNRAAGSMGAIGGHGQNPASAYKGTPFLTAEVGSGMEDTYFRRPVVSANDIGAIPTVMLGSGVNMLGFYLFHGGRNPDGGSITLQESQRTGYPTDVPVRSYDFQAPIGEFGQERPSLDKLKLVDYFLNDFGALLAPMAPHAPTRLPATPADASVPRLAVRTRADSGFIFLSNYVRGLRMPARPGFQISLKLPGETVRVPQQPIDLPSGVYGIWPVRLAVGSSTLRYATAQLFKRTGAAGQAAWYWFFAIPGVAPELLFAPDTNIQSMSRGITRADSPEGIRLRFPFAAESVIALADGTHIALLPEAEAAQVWSLGDPGVLLLTPAAAFASSAASGNSASWTLESPGNPHVPFGLFGTSATPSAAHAKVQTGPASLLFRHFVAEVPAVDFHPEVKKLQSAAPRTPWTMGPKVSWRPQSIPMAPDDSDFAHAAIWALSLPRLTLSPTLADAFLRIDYQGDVARLSREGALVDDNFWNGLPWKIGLREVASPATLAGPTDWQLSILPLPRHFPMYLQSARQLQFAHGVALNLSSVQIVPVYRVVLTVPRNH